MVDGNDDPVMAYAAAATAAQGWFTTLELAATPVANAPSPCRYNMLCSVMEMPVI